MREINTLPPHTPPKSVGSPALSALAELFYFRFNLITQHITHTNHHLSACHSIAPPATAIEGFLHGKGINWVSTERYETLVQTLDTAIYKQ